MLRLLLLSVLSLTQHVYTERRDCAAISFCSEMRHQEVDENFQYAAHIAIYKITDNVVTIPLTNSNGDELDLQISVITGMKARVKVLEKNHNRYELVDVLAKDFPAVKITKTDTEEGWLAFVPEYDENFIVRIKESAPFSVEFIYNDNVEVTLRGDRLVMRSGGAFSFDVEFNGSKKLYGLLHHAYKLALGETADGSADPFRFRNSDAPAVPVGTTQAMYGTVAAIYGHSPEHTFGIFLHNGAEEWVDISYSGDNPSAYFMVESGTLDLFVLVGPTPKEVVRQFTDLTGTAHLPQLWALGYHQCRYSYQSQEDVKNVVANMDTFDFPMDAIWLDIDYTNEKRYFTWNPDTYNDPEEMQKNLSSTNRKLVTIIDPHYKVDPGYEVYTGGAEKGLFLKWSDGRNFEDNCWPGTSSWFDFLNPEARDYYASWFAYDKFKGSTEVLAGIWNDMNEPSVFNGEYENTAPFELLHTGNVLHRDVHNLYGFLQTMATHQGLMQRDNGTKRPFVLTRSHFAGSQRYAAMWTGDNVAEWPFLRITYSECMTANLLGMVFCGADIGGFIGNPGDELMQRWYQAGIWLPFFRQHSNQDTNRREPYLFSEELQVVVRNAMKLRYKHIPVWYTLFYEHTRYGDPIIRPFFYDYPDNEERDDHVLIGTDILARPVLEESVSSVSVVFPGSEDTVWFRVDDDSWTIHTGKTEEEVDVDISTSPYYYRAGSIITRKERSVKSTTELRDVALTLFVNLDADNNAQGRYYQDDYESFKYSTDDKYFYINLTFISDTAGVRITTIDGDAEDVTPSLQGIVVHDMKGSEITYTRNSEGILLRDIDIAGHFAKTRTNEMTIFLKQ